MHPRLPLLALLLGLAGLVPFVALGLGALRPPPTPAAACLLGLVGYGAVILSFLGGVHWGFALAPGVGAAAPGTQLRLGLGILPSLIGWLAVVLEGLLSPDMALGVLVAGFAAAILAEQRLAQLGLMPYRYMWLRWGLSVAVVATLAVVALIRLVGVYVNF